MFRFYCLSSNFVKDRIVLSDKVQLHHLKNVVRLQPEDKAVLFDEQSNEYQAFLESVSDNSAVFRVVEVKKCINQNKFEICLACAIPKNTKIEDVIDKTTQLGVSRIIPLMTERVIVKLDKAKQAIRRKRWEAIALSACRQSHRSVIPVIDPVTNFKEAIIKARAYDLKLIPHLVGDRKSLKELIPAKKFKKVIVFIGPEGDFTPQEIDLALKEGFTPLTLGDLVLRVDTAAISVVGFLRFNA